MRNGCLGMTIVWLCLSGAPAFADTPADAYRAMGIKPADVITGTVLTSAILPGKDKQVVVLVDYFTGSKEETTATNVRLEVFKRDGERLVSIYSRDFGKENGGYVGRGDVELVDLDGDGANEIVVSYADFKNPVIERRAGEVIVHEPAGFRTAWAGDMDYDATRAARDVPAERRDRFTRKLDVPATLRTHGITLFFKKSVVAIAGERLPEPRQVQETFPLRPVPDAS